MRVAWLATVLLTASMRGPGQVPPPVTPPATLRTETTLVEVPATIRSREGSLIQGLVASDFRLFDNGVEQKLAMQENLHEPIAVIVLMQIGADAPRQFVNYPGLATMLDYALGSAAYRVSLVTFDSKPEDRWPFSTNADHLETAFKHPKSGDKGAAVLDAIDYGLDWFDNQHPRGRRIILLISQKQLGTNEAKSEAIVERLSETNTAVYSLTFSASTTWLKDQFTKERHGNPPYFFAPDHGAIMGTFDLLTPLRQAVSAMQENATATLADLSGGASLPFGTRQDLESQMTNFANELANRYLLSFQPRSTAPSLHHLRLEVPAQPELRVAVRSSYWRTPPALPPVK